jgi:hypothetical protein
VDGHDKFWTQEQIEYARSVALNQLTKALLADLKHFEFDHKPKGMFGVGLSLKVIGKPHPIHYYREKNLETEVVCEQCTLRYAIYGVFGFCPDCGVHNSLQILTKNLDLVRKMVSLASEHDPNVAEMLIANALEDSVSSFDGFGRETCRIHASKSTDPGKAESLSFQRIKRARERVIGLFKVDFAHDIDDGLWSLVIRCFQKRHLLAHKMGVVDQAYITATGDSSVVTGHKIRVHPDEVTQLVDALRGIARNLVIGLQTRP